MVGYPRSVGRAVRARGLAGKSQYIIAESKGFVNGFPQKCSVFPLFQPSVHKKGGGVPNYRRPGKEKK